MSVIQNIRDKYIGIVVIAIVVALVGFLIMDAMQSNVRNIFSSDRTLLAEINGKRIDAKSFDAIRQRYEDNMKAQKKGAPLTETERLSLNDQVWNDILNENLVSSENEKLGIVLTDKELQDMETGPFADPMIKQSFTDPNTGVFDPAKVSEYLNSLSSGKGEEQISKRNQWREFEEAIIKARLNTKYTDLITKSVYVPTFVLNQMARERSSIASISYVKLPYTMISDSAVKVTDQDIKDFMKKKESLLKSEEDMANAEYVVFDIIPTAADTAASLGVLNKIRAEFDSTDKTEELVAQYSEETSKEQYFTQDKLNPEKAQEIMAAAVGSVVGPYLDNGVYKMVKVLDKKSMPDSVKASHVLIAINAQRSEEAAKVLIDSIETAVKGGAPLEQLAISRSDDKGSAQKGGDLGFFGQGQMVPEFNDACFNGKSGDLKVVKSQFGYHLIRITEQKDFKPAVKLATISKSLQASEATIQAVYAKAAEFKSKASDAKSFADAAKKMSKDKRQLQNITKTQQTMSGLGTAREVSRWMFDAKIGDVSGVFNLNDKCVVASLVSRMEKGSLPDVESIRPQLEGYLKREKKGQMLIEKGKGKGSLAEIAAIGATEVKNIDSLLYAGGGNDSLGYEPRVMGAAFNKNLMNKLSPGIPGEQGVFFITVKNIIQPPAGPDKATPAMEMERKQQQQQLAGQLQGYIPQTLKKKAKITDNRSNFF